MEKLQVIALAASPWIPPALTSILHNGLDTGHSYQSHTCWYTFEHCPGWPESYLYCPYGVHASCVTLLECSMGVHIYPQPPGQFLVKRDNAVSNSYHPWLLQMLVHVVAPSASKVCYFSFGNIKFQVPTFCGINALSGAAFQFPNSMVDIAPSLYQSNVMNKRSASDTTDIPHQPILYTLSWKLERQSETPVKLIVCHTWIRVDTVWINQIE